MSKICGIVSENLCSNDIAPFLQKMVFSMKHCTWHSAEQWVGDNIGYGHISIGAVNEEAQPLFYRNGEMSIVFAGKIFDYEKNKRLLINLGHKFQYPGNDAEYVLHLFIEYGMEKFPELNGIFAFSIWDRKKKNIIVVNDRYGMRPMYYYHNECEKLFLFASELKAVARSALYEKRINWDAWNVFLRLGFLVGDDTFFSSIYYMPPASVLSYDMKSFSISSYWSYTQIGEKRIFNEDDDVDRLVELYRQAIKRRLMPDKKPTVLLSGGLDSSGIAAELARQGVQFASYTTRKFNYQDSDRRPAEAFAKMLGIKNQFIDLPDDFLETYEPLKNFLIDYQSHEHAWIIPLLNCIPSDIKINFDGVGFDNMCDSWIFHDSNRLGRDLLEQRRYDDFVKTWYYSSKCWNYLKWPIAKDQCDFPFFLLSLRKHFSSERFIEKIKEQLLKFENCANQYIFFHLSSRTRRSVGLCVNQLMANRLESFCPYLDNDLFDFCMCLPVQARMNRQLRKKILHRAHPLLFTLDSNDLTQRPIDSEYHHEFYTQKVREASRIATRFVKTLRSDVFDVFYLAPRMAKDLLTSRLYFNSQKNDLTHYNRLHHNVFPPLDMMNQWLINEEMPELNKAGAELTCR
jgi:asparagine synthase (glutamine-hydrolysing)